MSPNAGGGGLRGLRGAHGAQINFEDLTTYLKVACNENQVGSGRWHTFGIGIGSWRSMFFRLLILLSYLFYVFLFLPRKPKLIGDVPMNRQNAAARRIFFFLFSNAHCLLMH
jgi:hypothetical protein